MNLAYFFVPLPEPLGLPDGFVLEFTRARTYEEVLEAEREAHQSQEQLDLPVLTASLRFWRAQASSMFPEEYQRLFEVARQALPNLNEAAEIESPSLTTDRTIVEMAVPVSGDAREEAFSDAFDLGLACIREFQRAYYLVGSRYPITLATRERMPHYIPMFAESTAMKIFGPAGSKPWS